MKIRIANQIFDLDEKTIFDWIRLGRVPLSASVYSETLTDGRWQSVRELELVQSLWGLDADSATKDIAKAEKIQKELEVEQKFLDYQSRPPTITLTLLVLNIITFILLDQLKGLSKDQQTLIQFGAYSYNLIVEGGEYWRLLTNAFLHVGELHLILNMGLLFIVGSLIEGLYGRWRFLILYVVSAIGGGFASLPFVQHNSVGAGASGAIFGLMGVLIALGLRYKNYIPRRRGRIFGLRILPFIGIDIILGFIIPPINNAAHLGGLFTGFAGAMIFAPEIYANRERETKIVVGFASVLASLVIASGVIAALHYFTDSAEKVEKRMNTAFSMPHPKTEDFPGYIENYEKGVLKRPYDPRSYGQLEGLYLRAFKNFPDDPSWQDKLKQFYEKVLQADPDNPVWNNNLRWFYQKTALERPDEVSELEDYIKLCEKIARKQGYHQPLYQNLQQFYIRAKELEPQKEALWNQKLERFYKEAVEEAPENATWSNNLAWLYVEQETKPQKAVQLALNAAKQAPTEKNFLDTLAWAYLRNRQYHKALRAFELVFSVPLEAEEDLKAQESAWKGMTELVQAEKLSQESQDFDQAFLKFYDRLSRTFADDSEVQAKLTVIFDLFQQAHHRG